MRLSLIVFFLFSVVLLKAQDRKVFVFLNSKPDKAVISEAASDVVEALSWLLLLMGLFSSFWWNRCPYLVVSTYRRGGRGVGWWRRCPGGRRSR